MSITDDRLPRPRAKAGDPHRQRAAGVEQAVVHALAIPVELLARVLGQAAEFAVQVAIQAGPAEEDVHLQQLGLVGDPLGRLAAGDGAGEIHLRRPVDRVHVAPGVEGFAPGRGFDVRHAVFVACRREFVPRRLGLDPFHV